jgi:hypothetical protein
MKKDKIGLAIWILVIIGCMVEGFSGSNSGSTSDHVNPHIRSATPASVHVECDSCQAYGNSVADAVTDALKQSPKFTYQYFDSWADAHVVVTEHDGSVYIDLLSGNGTQRNTQNIAIFRKSGDTLNAAMVADTIYAYSK